MPHESLSERFISAWNSHDLERVLACYTEDVAYRDPNTRGVIQGRQAMRRYLRKLFDQWEMTWSVTSVFPLHEREGAAILWHATLRKRSKRRGTRVIETDGMDLVLLRGDLIERNEVYFDRAGLFRAYGLTDLASLVVTAARRGPLGRLLGGQRRT